MKTINVSEATGPVLDWLVAKCEGHIRPDGGTYAGEWQGRAGYRPSSDWALGGPIIEREFIGLVPGKTQWFSHGSIPTFGPTPLIAAMRCYVVSKLGAEAEVPEELL